MFEYLSLMLIFTFPFILFAVYKRRFRALGLAAVVGLVIGVPWDLISAGYFHTWFWNEGTLLGAMIGPLPLEEYLFMVLVPMMLIGAALLFKVDLYVCEPNKSSTESKGTLLRFPASVPRRLPDEHLKPNEVVPIKITWKPFTEQGIREKVKNGTIEVDIMPKSTVEIGD